MATLTKKITHTPYPELLSRDDVQHGKWRVGDCAPRRGVPQTNVVTREMLAPGEDTEFSRAIRAHEMMHAKVSPANDMLQWINRKVATHKALMVTEELRVNYLCTKAGFDMSKYLTDGSEQADGEKCVALRDWSSAIQMCIATVGTAAHKSFLTGIRRGDRQWGKLLLGIGKQALKEMKTAEQTGTLTSTVIDHGTGLFPRGFAHTERIAEWVDRLMDFNPDKKDDDEKKGKSKTGEEKTDDTDDVEPGHGEGGEPDEGDGIKKDLEKIKPTKPTGHIPSWGELRIQREPMPKITKGNLGKKRIATDIGKNPRRLTRIYTDPDKKIFDRIVRGKGGVVLIDASGSMSFSHAQIRQIVEAAPGATVAMYSECGKEHPNLWILAEKGKMCAVLPKANQNNGVDHPALEWAIKQRQRSSAPVVWVTDGGVQGMTGGNFEQLVIQCVKTCLKNNVVVVPHVDEAVALLKGMQRGVKAKRVWPPMFANVWQRQNGVRLPQ